MSAGRRTIDLPRVAVTSCFKVGSTSMQEWCSANGIGNATTRRNAPMGKPALAFIRDPVMRLQSAWRMFQFKHSTFPAPARGKKDYPTFVDRVLSGYQNPHWNAQAPFLETVTLVLPFETIEHVWPLMLRGQGIAPERVATMSAFPHANPTEPTDTDYGYRAKELDRFYLDDLNLYARAWTLYDFLREGFAPEALPPCEKERELATRARTPRSTSAA